MVITLTGENAFGLKAGLQALTGAFAKTNGDLALERVDGEEAEYAKIQEALTSSPFLAPKKMVVLSQPSKNKQYLENFEQLFSDLPETTEVVILEPKPDKRLAYYKFLKKSTDFRDFPGMDQIGLASWLVEAAKNQNGTLSSADARYLVERVGLNQQLIANELEKLLLYDPHITKQSIDLLTEPSPSSTIFNLLEAAFGGNTKRVLDLYAEQRALKVEPQQIIAMLAWQLHVLAVVKAAGDRSADQIAKEAGFNPFVIRKTQAIAKNLSTTEVKTLVNDLLEIDIKSKSVSIDLDEALQVYLLKLAQ